VDVDGDHLVIRGSTKAAVSELAFEHGIRINELSESSPSLEDSLLDMTSGSAEFSPA